MLFFKQRTRYTQTQTDGTTFRVDLEGREIAAWQVYRIASSEQDFSSNIVDTDF
jgi:hypothetical protein